MHSGVLNKENLANILRGLSQRRQQGTMEINLQDRVLRLSFVQGKITDVFENEIPALDEVAQILADAERIPAGTKGGEGSYRDLLTRLQEAGSKIDEEVFKQALRRRVLNKLYGMQLGIGAYFSFKIEMVENDRDLSPQVSVGQLLLDYVALETDGAQFEQAFPSDKVIRRGAASPSGMTPEEEIIYTLIGDEGLSLADLDRLSLLSRYHLQDSLLAMLKAGLIDVGERGAPAEDDVLGDDLDASIDSIFEKEMGLGSSAATFDPADQAKTPEPKKEVKAPPKLDRGPAMLQATWVPLGILVASIMAVVVVPMLRWSEALSYFMR